MADIKKAQELADKAMKEIGYSRQQTVNYLLAAQSNVPSDASQVHSVIDESVCTLNNGVEIDEAAMAVADVILALKKLGA